MGHDFIKNVTDIEGRIEKTNKTTLAWQAEDTANANTLKRACLMCWKIEPDYQLEATKEKEVANEVSQVMTSLR